MDFQIIPPDATTPYESYGLLPDSEDHDLLREVGRKILIGYVSTNNLVEHSRGEKTVLEYFAQTYDYSRPDRYLVLSDQVYGIAAVLASDIIDSFPRLERDRALEISQFMIDSIQKYGSQ